MKRLSIGIFASLQLFFAFLLHFGHSVVILCLQGGVGMANMKRVATTAERIKEAMEITDKKQADLVRETKLNRGTVSRYLSGEVEPRQAAMMKLAAAFNVSEMWLWGYDVPRNRSTAQMEQRSDILSRIVIKAQRDPQFMSDLQAFFEMDEEKRRAIIALIK
jgi:transcriptional regulator with XRE-family HTH domain